MTATAIDTIRIYCKAKERTLPYEADVSPDISVTEIIRGLNEAEYLPALAGGERWLIVHGATGDELPPNARLEDSGVKDGDQLEFLRRTHGAVA